MERPVLVFHHCLLTYWRKLLYEIVKTRLEAALA